MPTKKEQRLIDIIGWMWVAAVILALAFGGTVSLVIVAVLGIAGAAAYLIYKFKRDPHLFRRKRR